MEFLTLTPTQVELGLRAMCAVALADGSLDQREQSLLRVSAQALHFGGDPMALAALEPEEARDALESPMLRERLLQAMVVMSLMDGEVRPEELALVDRFARVLGIEEPRVRSLHQLHEGHLRMLWLDLARRSWARKVFEETLHEEGFRGVWKIVGPMMGKADDEALANRYRVLENYPAGSFGKAYFDFIRANHFGLPGEHGGLPERGVWHDLSHVLSGYQTHPVGEVQVTAFIAGYKREDPFFWVFTNAIHFHLGVKVTPYAVAERNLFDPELVVPALQRGMAMNKDLSQPWDFWADFSEPLESLRTRFGVPPP